MEEYGLEILTVQEIRDDGAVTQINNTPDFIKGVVNLRGKIVPIVDLRIKFHLEKVEYDEFKVVIILNLSDRVIGVVVDGVSDVMSIKNEQIGEVPALVTNMDTKYIIGLVTFDSKMLIFVDIEQLISSAGMALLDGVVH